VLVADDDPHALSGYLEFLGRSGFVASGSVDGQEALGLAVETVPDI
jgi:DNA-binding response OmpR family regulator